MTPLSIVNTKVVDDLRNPSPNPSNYPKTQMKGEKMSRESLSEIYLDWVNNYLTIEKFAEHKGLYVEEAKTLLSVAKQCFEKIHPEA